MSWNENFDWIGKNYDKLLKDFRNKWVAVLDCKVVASGDSLSSLKKKMKKEHPEKFEEIAFEFITDRRCPDFDSG